MTLQESFEVMFVLEEEFQLGKLGMMESTGETFFSQGRGEGLALILSLCEGG